MKNLIHFGIASLIFVHGFSAFAMPEIGDFTRFEGTLKGHKIAEETLIISYQAKTQQYEEQDTAWQDGQEQSPNVEWVDAAGLPSASDISTLLGFCASSGGTPETITVPAGTFDTCRMPTSDLKGYVNMGNVPFGTVKYVGDTSDPNSLNMSLVKYTLGQ